MATFIISVFVFFVSIEQAHAENSAANLEGYAQKDYLENSSKNVLERRLHLSPLGRADLDDTMLAKSAHLSNIPSQGWHHTKPSFVAFRQSRPGPQNGRGIVSATRGNAEGRPQPAPVDPVDPLQPLGRRHAGLAAVLGSVAAMTMQPTPVLAGSSPGCPYCSGNLAQPTISEFTTEGFIDGPDGIKYQDVRVGRGNKVATPGSKVKINYRMFSFPDGFEIDANQRPFVFTVGSGAVFKGWEEAILGSGGMLPMKVDGRRKVVIPPGLGSETSTPIELYIDLKSVN